MNKRITMLAIGVVLLGSAAMAVAEEDLASLEQKLVEAWGKHKSVTAKLKLDTNLEMGGGVSMHSTSEGTLEILKKEGQTLSRMELKTSTVQKMGDQEMKIEQTISTIVDGEFTYMFSEVMGQKTARKTKSDPSFANDVKSLFKKLREETTLTILPDDSVDGKPCYVLQAVSKEPTTPGQPAKILHYFAKDSGVILKQLMYTNDKDEKPMTTMLYSDVKLDVKIDPDRFKFVPPPGVQVIDATNE